MGGFGLSLIFRDDCVKDDVAIQPYMEHYHRCYAWGFSDTFRNLGG
jgi:hypothetical protein